LSTAADPRVVRSLDAQLGGWRNALAGGARRVGWKIGLNIPEVQARLGLTEPVIGHLTSATEVPRGGTYSAAAAVALKAEPELALELGRDVGPDAEEATAGAALAALAPSIEVVDTGRPPADLEGIVAGNVFHRAFTLGAARPSPPARGTTATISVNGESRESGAVPVDFSDVVTLVARLLGAVGERLLAGDWIIAGSLTAQVPVQPGDLVRLEIDGLGDTELRVGP
jgi:2-keto-4-pentenoate hydratase